MNTNIKYLIPEGVSMGIYIITAPDGHYYIGSSRNLKRRWREHFNALNNNTHHSPHMKYRYWAHPDWVWKFELLEKVDQDEQLLAIEQIYLNMYHGLPLCLNMQSVVYKKTSVKVSTFDSKAHYQKNKHRIREYYNIYYKTHKRQEYYQLYYQKNREKRIQQVTAWQALHPRKKKKQEEGV